MFQVGPRDQSISLRSLQFTIPTYVVHSRNHLLEFRSQIDRPGTSNNLLITYASNFFTSVDLSLVRIQGHKLLVFMLFLCVTGMKFLTYSIIWMLNTKRSSPNFQVMPDWAEHDWSPSNTAEEEGSEEVWAVCCCCCSQALHSVY